MYVGRKEKYTHIYIYIYPLESEIARYIYIYFGKRREAPLMKVY